MTTWRASGPYKTLDDVHQSLHHKSIAQHHNTMSTNLDERFPHTDANIREVAPGVWTISAPFSRGGIPMGNRTTAIVLKSGGVWVLASTPADGPTTAKLDALGPVAYIVSGDAEHHAFLADYKKAYPQAKLVANETVAKTESALHFDGVFGRDAPNTRYGFEDDIEHVYFSGHRKGDVAFFHPASRSLLVQDLLFNQPAKDEHNESYANSEQTGHAPLQEKIFQPFSGLHKLLESLVGGDKEAMRRDVNKVSAWDFDRIITCHGNIIETDGKKSWNSAFEQYVD